MSRMSAELKDEFVEKAFHLFDRDGDGIIEECEVERDFVDGRAGSEVVRLIEEMGFGGKGVTWEVLEAQPH